MFIELKFVYLLTKSANKTKPAWANEASCVIRENMQTTETIQTFDPEKSSLDARPQKLIRSQTANSAF